MSRDSTSSPDLRLHQAVFTASERSKSEVGQSMHDTLCQTLSGSVLMVRVLASRLKEGHPIEAAEMDSLAEKLDRALDEARAIFTQLQPVFPRAEGLMTALARLAHETSATTPCAFECEDVVLVENPEAALTLYRIAEEAVKNALAHAQATHIKISLTEPDGCIALQVSDDGRRAVMPSNNDRMGSGEIMRCRAAAAGGTFTRDSAGGQGATIICSLPAKNAHAGD